MASNSRNVSYYNNAMAITPSDSENLTNEVVALVVGASGTVKVDTVGGQTGVTVTMTAGSPLELHVQKVYATGTTATGISGLW